jgi:hypothetical protein
MSGSIKFQFRVPESMESWGEGAEKGNMVEEERSNSCSRNPAPGSSYHPPRGSAVGAAAIVRHVRYILVEADHDMCSESDVWRWPVLRPSC